MIERIADRIERELDVVEMVDAAPSVIRRLKAQRVARAALEAMREPTWPMAHAGVDAYMHEMPEGERFDGSGIGMMQAWRGMIDAALTAQDS